MDTSVCFTEIPAEVLSQRLDCRFGSIVCGVSRRVCDSLFAASNYDGGRLRFGSFLHDRQECIHAVDDAKQIRLQDLG